MTQFPITVLLVDDQAIIGEAVRRMLDGEPDITFHFCQDPTKALGVANEIHPTVILQDLVMPDVDGLTLVKFFRANAATRETPMIVLSSKEEPIVKAEAFAIGANDYLVKLPDRIELLARIRHHSKGYINLLERNEAYAALERSREQLAGQIRAGVKFVLSLLPAPMAEPVRVDWRYVPCAELGGDTFGYHWIDDDHFAFYLIDVSGHGLDSALLSVTVMNVLRSRSLPNTDFRVPGQVLTALNDGFPMESYGDKFFTMWYGVFRRSDRTLSWACGGHPAALLFEPASDDPCSFVKLASEDPMIGAFPWPAYETHTRPLPAQSRLYLYSDGVHEIHKPDGSEWEYQQFLDFMVASQGTAEFLPDRLFAHVRGLKGADLLDDDFSILELCV